MSVIARTSIKLLMTNHDYVTGMETCEFSYELTIINIIQWSRKKIKSPSFSSGYSDFNDEWILEIYPSSTDCTIPAWILVDLQPQSCNTAQLLQTKCKIKISNRKGKSKEYNFDEFPKKITWNSYISTSDLLDPLNGYLQNGELKICCTIKMSRKLTNNSDVTLKFIGTQQLTADLEKLLLNDKSADVTIQVGQKSFRVIKGILGARSPVFAAMFDHEQFKENENNKVVLEDIDEDVFKEFLHFIYTGETSNVDKMPMKLLAVAEKYQVDGLKKICEAILCETINSINFASILVCSDECNLKKLNNACLKFMKENSKDIMSSETFKVYKKKHPKVFVSVLEELLSTATSQKPVYSCRIL